MASGGPWASSQTTCRCRSTALGKTDPESRDPAFFDSERTSHAAVTVGGTVAMPSASNHHGHCAIEVAVSSTPCGTSSGYAASGEQRRLIARRVGDSGDGLHRIPERSERARKGTV